MDFLTRLRSKSPLVRAQYALGMAAVATGVIALIWLSTLPARFSNIGELEDAKNESIPTLRTNPGEGDNEEQPEYEGVTEGLGSLGTHIDATETAGAASVAASSSSGARVIQIGTTSQNRN